MKIGIIRWDAYFKTGESDSFVSDQVARALSPAEYHDRVPFFASIRSDGRVEFPEYTQQIWERETDYAVDAGFDYYAYCWYRTKDPLSLARRFHAASKNPGRIKMAAILGVTKEDEQTIDDLFACMSRITISSLPTVRLLCSATARPATGWARNGRRRFGLQLKKQESPGCTW